MGRPKGSLNDKPWKEAIRRAVNKRAVDGGKAIDGRAMAAWQKAHEGEVAALREIGDRLEGKASQPIEHSGHWDVAMRLDRVITEMREREMPMRLPAVTAGRRIDISRSRI